MYSSSVLFLGSSRNTRRMATGTISVPGASRAAPQPRPKTCLPRGGEVWRRRVAEDRPSAEPVHPLSAPSPSLQVEAARRLHHQSGSGRASGRGPTPEEAFTLHICLCTGSDIPQFLARLARWLLADSARSDDVGSPLGRA